MRNTAELTSAMQAARKIAIVTHVNPDGDAIGSALALKLGLEAMGKTAAVFDQDKVPDMLSILPGWQEVRRPETLKADERFDLLLVVDVAAMDRMGACTALLERCACTAQIDHHGTNPLYCGTNVVDGAAPAAGVIVYEVLKQLNVPITREISMCLYAAVSTDTGNFAYSSTSAEAFRMMSELMEAGLPLNEMNRRLFLEHDRAQVLLLQRALSTLTFHHDGQVTSMVLTARDFAECGALSEHADTIVNYGISVRGVRMTALARETERGVKVSLRALAPCEVSGIAKSFGGGGHAQAAGCTMQGNVNDCAAILVDCMNAYLDENADRV